MDAKAYESLKDQQDEHWWFAGRRKIIRRLLEKYCNFGKGSRILEAGCGYGGNLSLLSEFGDLDAFEFNESAREFASNLSGIEVLPGKLPDGLQLGARAYDVIALLDVLEHIDEDTASLKALAAQLSNQGRILITVPAFQWLWSAHDETHHHKRRYSRQQLEECIRSADLRVVNTGYFNTLLFPLTLGERGFSRLRRATGRGTDIPPPLINTLFKGIFGLERHLVGRVRMPVGLSLFAVAEKK